MKQENLPVLTYEKGTIKVVGRTSRLSAHGPHPTFHATSVIAAVLPDGRLMLTDKTQKQREKGRAVPQGTRIFDIFGGHMRYEDIPPKDIEAGLHMETYRVCAARELSEELLRLSSDGSRIRLEVETDRLLPVGLYTLENDHNREYSWLFLYPLPDFGPYISEDTLETETKKKTIAQPIHVMNWEEVWTLYCGQSDAVLSDALGRVLAADGGQKMRKQLASIINKEVTHNEIAH